MLSKDCIGEEGLVALFAFEKSLAVVAMPFLKVTVVGCFGLGNKFAACASIQTIIRHMFVQVMNF
jgi:hypothetical protein